MTEIIIYRIMRIFEIVFVVFSINACTNATLVNRNGRTINIDVSKSIKSFEAEKLLDTVGHKVIVLDTTNNSFIGHVEKLFVAGDKIYVWDRERNAIFIYDSDGKYVSKIASQGRANNEYIEIFDFYVSKDRLYILDNATMRLLEYDATGKYIKTLDLSMYWAESLFVLDDMIYLVNYSSDTNSGQYHIFKIDRDGNFKDKYLKFDKNYRHSPDLKACSKVNGVFSLCMCPNFIYRVDSASCRLAYNIDFIDKNLPEKYYEQDLIAMLKEGVVSKYILGINEMQESSNYLFIYFWDDWNYYTALYDKGNGDVTVCKDMSMSSMYRMGFVDYYIYDDCVYGIVGASAFKGHVAIIMRENEKSKDKYIEELEKVNREITDYSNPVIIKYKLKS